MRNLTFADRILKVNHAGENGAIHIYAAQILVARLTAPSLVPELAEFKVHEEKHRSIFGAELQRRGVPRCRSYWLCAAGGFTLGIITALLGSKAIAATTAAVERVVLGHLEHQLQTLAGEDEAAITAIAAIVNEERQHLEQSSSRLSGGQFRPRIITPLVSASTESVIWLGMHL